MNTVLITGANRGLGLAFCQHYLNQADFVIACCRHKNSAKSLQQLAREYPEKILIEQLDVTIIQDIKNLVEVLQSRPIDIVINNAGIYKIDEYDYTLENEPWEIIFATNTIAPYLISQAFKNNLQEGQQKKIINISSYMASISLNDNGIECPYRASKAALNAVTKNLALEFAEQQIIVTAIDPGWVQTDMGGPGGLLTPKQSTAAIATVINQLTLADSGKFISYDRRELAW